MRTPEKPSEHILEHVRELDFGKRAEKKLEQAWREVPDDPHSVERRHYEERMRVENQARADAAKH